MFSIDLDIGDVVLENSGNVDLFRMLSVSFVWFQLCVSFGTRFGCRWRCSGGGLAGMGLRTSGNVPLEKTLEEIHNQYVATERGVAVDGMILTSTNKFYHRHHHRQ